MDDRKVALFWSKVDSSGGPDACWPWTAAVSPLGYGRFNSGSGTVTASRKALELNTGMSGECAIHSCDNPPCCNPGHLRWGTKAENSYDMKVRFRSFGQVGSESHSSILTEADIPVIRDLLALGATCRQIAEVYEVSRDCIKNISAGRSWRHVP